jgi:histidinol dehydrogenase
MQVIKYPKREDWPEIVKRPVMDTRQLSGAVASIIAAVRTDGDDALRRFSREFDGIDLEERLVTADEFAAAEALVSEELKHALDVAKANIEKFHTTESFEPRKIETTPGILCWNRYLPIEKVGLYVPAGSAPLFSTVLMLAIPAKLAGCREIVMCSPPGPDGAVNPTTLYAARLCGVAKVYKIGGAQAIAAMAYGTESVPSVYKIFGPGNQYVTEAKLQVMRDGIAIDMPAGPSEVAVLADDTCVPAFVAADLLSQAEHGSDSQVLLASDSEQVICEVLAEVERQVDLLPRHDIAVKTLVNSKAVLMPSVKECIELLNEYAAEHLILAVEDAEKAADTVTNAGSIFLGNYSCESAGDYASGTNHTLPTNGSARAFSGVSTASFMKTITYQQISVDGIRNLGPVIETMAAAEGLEAHRNAVSIRREYLG